MNETQTKTPNKKLRNALLRALAAALAGLILLAVTGFAFLDLIRGPKEVDLVQDEAVGSFVKRDVFVILGFYDEAEGAAKPDAEKTTPTEVSGHYALVPMGNKFVTVHFSDRYLKSAGAVLDDTYAFINQKLPGLDQYLTVQGTVDKLDEATSTKLYDWFGLNKDWMVQSGVIADTDDYADYLSDAVLEVDSVNGMNQNLVFALTGLAALCLAYAIVVLLMMAFGHYLEEEPIEPFSDNEWKDVSMRLLDEKEAANNETAESEAEETAPEAPAETEAEAATETEKEDKE
ncbi:MAG: DUF6709 family protein [Oscillospiraceae bacterium]